MLLTEIYLAITMTILRAAPGLQVLPVLVLQLPPEVLQLPPEVPLPVPLSLGLAALAECLPVANLEVQTVELEIKVIRRFPKIS